MNEFRILKGNQVIYKSIDKDDGIITKYIGLTDRNDKRIYTGDILSNGDIYHTVFEVPGGYAIESNPVSFGLYDENDPFPVYESTADQQTASYIRSNCEVVGNIYQDVELYNKIKDEYKSSKNRILQG